MNKTPHEQLVSMAYKAGAISKHKREKNILDYSKNPNKCVACGKPLSYERRKNKFCNQSCAATYNNLKRSGTKHLKDKLDEKTCKNCGGPIHKGKKESFSNALKRDFCSLKCKKDYKQKEFVAKWKAGEVSGTSSENDIHERVREYMLEKANYSCEICGWNEVNPTTGKVPVQVHHIDGDCTNNHEENLQVLCPNCHSLTPTYGAQNRGSGRFNRLKYKTKKYLEEKAKEEL